MILRPPRSTRPGTLVPYTTRVRSDEAGQGGIAVRRPAGVAAEQQAAAVGDGHDHRRVAARVVLQFAARAPAEPAGAAVFERGAADARSEEHTSELQSLMRISYAVFCLKKKKINK